MLEDPNPATTLYPGGEGGFGVSRNHTDGVIILSVQNVVFFNMSRKKSLYLYDTFSTVFLLSAAQRSLKAT